MAVKNKILQTEKLLLLKEGSCGESGECQFSVHIQFSEFLRPTSVPPFPGQGNTRK